MLIGGDDVSYDVITPWHVFFNVCLHSRSFPLLADWRKSNSSVDREQQGNWRWNSNSRDIVASSPSFSHHAARAPRRACSQTNSTLLDVTRCIRLHTLLHVVACCWELICKVWNRSNVQKQCWKFLRPFAPNFKSWLRLNIDVSSVALNILNSQLQDVLCSRALAKNCAAPLSDKEGGEAKNWKEGKAVRVVSFGSIQINGKLPTYPSPNTASCSK